ncbi:MAG TPA: hypothetical protein VH722_02530 [Alphaproteobacteria bacterium]|jgi:hypothetical protein|nr:hypothetical protein [Alphaproteobacteria bacterium]
MTSSSPAANTDPYLWVGSSTGRWRDGANWQDQTTDEPGTFPTFHNAVQFGVDTPDQQTQANVTVTGNGGSASLGLYGGLTLAGTFRTGALNLFLFYKPSGDTYLTSTLTVTGAGDSLRAGSAHAAGNLAVNDGAAVTVRGGYDIASGAPTPNPARYENYGISVDGAGSRVTIGGVLSTDNASDLLVTDGGYLEARRMVLDNTFPVGAYAVDAQSTIEVGTLGNAAVGTWTIDSTRTLVIEKNVRLSAPEFVVNGWIDDVGGLDLMGSPGNVTGTGRIKIEAGALLTIGQSGDQLSTVFKGSGAELDLADGAAAFTSTIRQFAAGESILVSGATFDSATWKAGVLSLFDSGTLVGTLKMAGAYKGDTFSVSNNTITLDASANTGSAADKTRSLQLFNQAMAGFDRHTPALHEVSGMENRQAAHPVLAAAH